MNEPVKTSLVILLHGFGSRGSDIATLASAYRERLPDTLFIAPNAPDRASFGIGYQWFSLANITEQNRPARIVEARPSFDEIISRIVADEGFEGRLDRVAFIGFSQGTIMGLDAIASGRWPIAGLVGFSGRLASPLPIKPPQSTRVLLVHGEADTVIPAEESRKAASVLVKSGVDVETLLVPGVDHTIPRDGVEKAGSFLAGLFSTPTRH